MPKADETSTSAKAKGGESADRALKRLKTKLESEGILEEVRRLRAFETPEAKKKRKARANARRARHRFRFSLEGDRPDATNASEADYPEPKISVLRLTKREVDEESIARLVGCSESVIRDVSKDGKVSTSLRKRLAELHDIFVAVMELNQDLRETVAWLETANDAFSGRCPVDLIREGESNRLWGMIYDLKSGNPG